jgi:hypothetical protein
VKIVDHQWVIDAMEMLAEPMREDVARRARLQRSLPGTGKRSLGSRRHRGNGPSEPVNEARKRPVLAADAKIYRLGIVAKGPQKIAFAAARRAGQDRDRRG